jgi:hypothetical protein
MYTPWLKAPNTAFLPMEAPSPCVEEGFMVAIVFPVPAGSNRKPSSNSSWRNYSCERVRFLASKFPRPLENCDGGSVQHSVRERCCAWYPDVRVLRCPDERNATFREAPSTSCALKQEHRLMAVRPAHSPGEQTLRPTYPSKDHTVSRCLMGCP